MDAVLKCHDEVKLKLSKHRLSKPSRMAPHQQAYSDLFTLLSRATTSINHHQPFKISKAMNFIVRHHDTSHTVVETESITQ